MKYINAKDVFPDDLLQTIQRYTQGNYVYIPRSHGNREKWGSKTSFKQELLMRNKHIYQKYLSGCNVEWLAREYCLSVKSIRRIILVKRKESNKMKDKIEKLLADNWNIESEVYQIYPTAWSVGEDFVIKASNDFGKLKRNITMIKVLDEFSIPVAVPVSTINGNDYVELDNMFYFLSKKFSGKEIINIYEEEQCFEIVNKTGRLVGNLHKALLSCENKIAFWDNSLLDEMNGWITKIFKENNYHFITKIDLENSIADLASKYDNLPKQLIHRDLYYGNILFDNGELSGYVDFDFSQKNIRMFDNCYFLLGLLVDRIKNKPCIEMWKLVVKEYLKGYESILQLEKQEKESICSIMKCIELLFVAYFIREKDEACAKSAAEVYYFIRENETEILSLIN